MTKSEVSYAFYACDSLLSRCSLRAVIFCSEFGSKNDKSSCFKGGMSLFDLTQFEVDSNCFEKILKKKLNFP